MSKEVIGSRLINKYTQIIGVVPTTPSPPSLDDHTSPLWQSTDIYKGEFYLNIQDDRLFTRTNNGIREIPVYEQNFLTISKQLKLTQINENTTNKILYYNTVDNIVSYGDITSISLANGLSQRLVTSTGISAIQGEPNLTFNNTTNTLSFLTTNPSTIVGTTEMNVFNTTSTTVNAFGAATTLTMVDNTSVQTINIGTGTGTTNKTINIGTGRTGGTTNITIGNNLIGTNINIGGDIVFQTGVNRTISIVQQSGQRTLNIQGNYNTSGIGGNINIDAGIGTTANGGNININGGFGDGGAGGNVNINGGNGDTNGEIYIGTQNTSAIYIGDSLNNTIPIATYDPDELLFVDTSDNYRLKRGTTPSSDIRLKENIENLKDPLEKILKLRGVNFTWIKNPEQGVKSGLIAQELEEIIPELVYTNKIDGYKGVNYTELISYLIEAIKEQQIMIDELKNKINN